jgi:uncharacterized protein
MLIENSFEVPAPIDYVWNYMQDVQKVVVCMPGAQLTETIDADNYKGKILIKLGPVSLSFNGKVSIEERDETAHRVVMKGSGMEQRGKGAASATVTSSLEEVPNGTLVKVVQDLKVQGQAAQFSRGMMQDVSSKLTKQFADCLKTNMAAERQPAAEASGAPEERTGGEPASSAGAPAPAPTPQMVAKPVGGIRLALSALGSAIVRFFKRLFGGRNRA